MAASSYRAGRTPAQLVTQAPIAPTLGAAPPERAAERAEPRPAPAPEYARLEAIRAEADRLDAQLAALPMGELRRLDRLAGERAQWQRSATTPRRAWRRCPRRSAP